MYFETHKTLKLIHRCILRLKCKTVHVEGGSPTFPPSDSQTLPAGEQSSQS